MADSFDDGDYYNDDDFIDDDDYDEYHGLNDDNDVINSIACKPYTILPEFEIRKRQEDRISNVSSTLCISNQAASKLLYHYKWEPSLAVDEWYANESKTRATTGLLSDTTRTLLDVTEELEIMCKICFDLFPCDDLNLYRSDYCGHVYCVTCWNGYISTSINDGPGCLSLRCPEPNCKASICRDMVDKLVGPVEKEKYDRFLRRSFTDGSKKVKWCPAPGCENGVEFELGSDVFDVTCLCTHAFCWNCVEEIHRPVDCTTVANWILKNSSESENTAWILANSKPCPKCNRAIEKNSGCMHMTCSPPCKFEFCWLCLGDWTKHGEKTGGFYACNTYESDKINGVYDEDEVKRRLAKNHVEKYTHYYERWVAHDVSRQKAIRGLEDMKNKSIASLSICLDKPETDFDFILEAWEQIIECRRVLKWTYAYGYYIPDDQSRKRVWFECLQGEAEATLERLHQCAEKEVLELFEEVEDRLERVNKIEERRIKYIVFQEKLNRLTGLTRLQFDKLFGDLEKGLPVVETEGSSEGGSSRFDEDEDDLNQSHYWTCSVCTFANPNTLDKCQMCSVGELPLRIETTRI